MELITRLSVGFCLLLPSICLADWGLLHPDGRLTDVQTERHVGRESDGESVEVLHLDVSLAAPMAYDSARKAAILNVAVAQAQSVQQIESDQAAADLASERLRLRALLAQAIAALVTDEQQRTADLLALPAATATQQRAILTRLLQREQLRIRLDELLLRAVAGQLGISTSAAGLR